MKASPDSLKLPPPDALQVSTVANGNRVARAAGRKTSGRSGETIGKASSSSSTSAGSSTNTSAVSNSASGSIGNTEPSRPQVTVQKVKSPFGETRVAVDAVLPGKPKNVRFHARLRDTENQWENIALILVPKTYAWKGVLVLTGESASGSTVDYYLEIKVGGTLRNIGSIKKPISFTVP